jgi:hypothetical protein
MIRQFSPGFVFDDKVEDGASSVRPSIEMESDTSGGNF